MAFFLKPIKLTSKFLAMRNSRQAPTVNAGSMADIAFLLLLFFLVSTTISNDMGIIRKLPDPCPPGQNCETEIHERNVLRIVLNDAGDLFVGNNTLDSSELLGVLKEFIDNNGDATCSYCTGDKQQNFSDNPREAIISISTSRNTPYSRFIAVQNEITTAYYELRAQYVKTHYNKDVALLSAEEIQSAKDAYPFKISEAALK